jgi:NADH dehydrogenase
MHKNQVDGVEGVYFVRDVAYMQTEKYPNGHPQVAQGAIQQAKNLGNNFVALSKNKKQKKSSTKIWVAWRQSEEIRLLSIYQEDTFQDFLRGWFGWLYIYDLFLARRINFWFS